MPFASALTTRARAEDAAAREAAMASVDRYARPIEQVEWEIPGAFPTVFEWEYERGSESLRRLYEKGKNLQWNASSRIDWSQDLDPANPPGLPDAGLRHFGAPGWGELAPS